MTLYANKCSLMLPSEKYTLSADVYVIYTCLYVIRTTCIHKEDMMRTPYTSTIHQYTSLVLACTLYTHHVNTNVHHMNILVHHVNTLIQYVYITHTNEYIMCTVDTLICTLCVLVCIGVRTHIYTCAHTVYTQYTAGARRVRHNSDKLPKSTKIFGVGL